MPRYTAETGNLRQIRIARDLSLYTCTKLYSFNILHNCNIVLTAYLDCKATQTRMWADAQGDGRPAEYVQRRKVWLTPATGVPCSNAAKTMQGILPFNKFFPIVDTSLSCEDIARQSCGMAPRWRFLAIYLLFIMYIVHKVQNIRNTHIKHTTGIKRYK